MGQPLVDGVHSLKHAVSELHILLQTFVDDVAHDVRLAARVYVQLGDEDFLQGFLGGHEYALFEYGRIQMVETVCKSVCPFTH